ncbi:hypothetical protein WICMUC_001878 [Wickerhamomyces mucosus]|uniref:PH domain-containing protein n=1 Tax=Wickerhamomyces mucosus TaxID=1378264 RepID=A0A9P8PRR8_9ASCO|nr:hypothetical protein WICMUC_001878 [Wickerhamomyces mucosus]
MAPSDHDLKSQLSDIQARLSEATLNTPKRTSMRREHGDQPTSPPTASANQLKHNPSLKSKKSLSSLLNKKDKRVSLPSFDSSQSLSTPQKGQGKDMNFVVGLSENLLQECRRLQAENQFKSQRLKSTEDEFEKLKSSNANLLNKLNETLQNEERFKDTNWELELKLQQLSQEFKNVTENYNKQQRELNKQVQISHNIKSELEEVNLNKVTLEKEFSTNKTSVNNEIQVLKAHVDELNDVNYRLNDEIDELRKKLEDSSKPKKESALTAIPVLKPIEDTDSEEEYGEPPISPVKTIPVNNTALESESLKVSLNTAHRTITKLRNQILKMRGNELMNKNQQGHNNSPDSIKKLTGLKGKKLKGLNELGNRNFHIVGSSNRNSRIIFEDSTSEVDEEDDWENYEGENTIRSVDTFPEKKPLRSLSTTSQELISDTGSEFDDDDLNENFSAQLLSNDLETAVKVTKSDVDDYAKQHGLIMLPIAEFDELKELSKPLTDDQLHIQVKSRGLLTLSEKEINSKSEEILQLRSDLNNASDLIRQLQNEIDTPSESYIKQKASAKNLHILPIPEFQSMSVELNELKEEFNNPSIPYLTQKGKSRDLAVLNKDEHLELLSNIDSLSAAKNELTKQLDVVSFNHKNASQKNTESMEQLKQQIHELQEFNNDYKASTEELTQSRNKLQQMFENEVKNYNSLKEELTKKLSDITRAHELEVQDLTAKHTVKINDLSHDVDIYKNSVDVLTKSELKLKSQLEDLSSKHSELSQENKDLDAAHEKAISIHQEEASTSANEIKDLSAKVQELESANSEDHQLISELKQTKLNLETLSAEISAEVDLMKTQLHQVTQHNSRLLTSIADKDSEYKSMKIKLTKNLEDLSLVKVELEERLGKKDQEFVLTKSRLTEKLEKLASVHAVTVDEHKSVNESLTQKIQEFESKYKTIEQSNNELNLANSVFKRSLEEEISNHKSTHSDLSKKLITATQLYEKAVNDHNSYINKLNIQSLAMEEENQSRIKELEEINDAHQKSIDRLKIAKADLQQLFDEPSESYIYQKASAKGLKVLETDVHENELTELNEKIISSQLELEGLKSEFQKKNEISTRLIQDLKAKYTDAKSEISKLSSNAALIKEQLQESKGNFEILKMEFDNPGYDYLTEKARKQGLTVIPKLEHSALIEKSNRSLHEIAKAAGFIALPIDEHSDIVSQANNPSLEHLKQSANKLNHKVIPLDQFDEISTRAAKSIKQLADEQNLKLLPAAELLDLQRKALSPSLDELVTHSKAYDHAVISKIKLDDLKAQSAKTIYDYARESNSIVLTKNSYDTLSRKAKDPSVDELAKHAASKNFILLPLDTHNKLSADASRTAQDLATVENLILLTRESHEELTRRTTNPTIEEIYHLVETKGFTAIDSTEYGELLVKAAKSVEELAKEQDLTLLKVADYEELSRKAKSPSIEFLKSKAEDQSHRLVSSDEYESLLFRANKSLEKMASEQNMKLLTMDEHNSILCPSKSVIVDQADKLGLVAIAKPEHEALVRQSQAPTKEHLSAKAKLLGLEIISESVHQELIKNSENPSKEFIIKKALIHDLVAIDASNYNSIKEEVSNLKRDLTNKTFLVEKVSSEGNVVLTKEDYNRLVERSNVSIEELAKAQCKVVLDESTHTELTNPSKDKLIQHADKKDLVLISKEHHHDLIRSNEAPSLGHIQTKASLHGHIAIPKEYYDKIRSDSESPSISFLEENAKLAGFAFVADDEWANLKAQSNKTIDELALEQNKVILSQAAYDQAQHPNKDIISQQAKAVGLVAVEKTFYELLQTEVDHPTTEQLSIKAEALSYALIKKQELQDLRDVTDSPSLEFLEKKTRDIGYHILQEDEFEELNKKAGRTAQELAAEAGNVIISIAERNALFKPSRESIIIKVEEFGLTTIDPEELRLLKEPSKEESKRIALSHGFVVTDKDTFEDLKAKSNKTIHDLAKENHSVILSQEDYRLLSNPSNAQITKLASAAGLVALTNEDHFALVNPSNEQLQLAASKSGFELVSTSGLEDLKKKASRTVLDLASETDSVVISRSEHLDFLSPNKDTIINHAANLGLLILSKEEHRALSHPNIDALGAHASREGLKLLSAQEYNSLMNPSEELVEQRANKRGLLILKKEDYKDLAEPSREKLSELASSQHLIVLDSDEYNALQKPSKEIIDKNAALLGLSTIEKSELEFLKDSYRTPSTEFIIEKAKENSLVALKSLEFDELSQKASRTIDDLAREKGVQVVSKDDLHSLRFPTVQKLKSHVDAVDHVMISKLDLENINNPSIEVLSSKSTALGYTLLANDEHELLSQKANNPRLEELKDKAESFGYALVNSDDFKEFTLPSVDWISQQATRINYVLLSTVDYDKLKSPHISLISENASKHNHVVIESKEYDRLKTPNIEDISKRAKELGHIIISAELFESLENPPLSVLSQKVSDLKFALVTAEDYKVLKDPSLEFLSEKATAIGYTVINLDEYKALKTPNIDNLSEKAKMLDHVLVPLSEFQLLKDPSMEVLSERAGLIDHVLVHSHEYNNLRDPSFDFLTERARSLACVLTPIEEFEMLKNPQIDALSERAVLLDHVLVHSEEYQSLLSPSIDSLRSKASEINHAVIPKHDYDDLKSPSVTSLKQKASALNYTLVSNKDYQFLKSSLESPTIETLTEKAEAAGFKIVLKSEFDSLVEKVESPEIAIVAERAKLLGFDLVSNKEYSELLNQINKPQPDFIRYHANKQGILTLNENEVNRFVETHLESRGEVSVPSEDYNSLKAQVETPGKDSIERYLKDTGSILITKKAHEALLNSANRISKTDLEGKAAKIDHVLISKNDYDEYLESKSIEFKQPSTPSSKFAATKDYFENVSKSAEKDKSKAKVFESAKSLGFVPVASDEYKRLIENQKEHVITKSDVYKSAREFNLAVLPTEEYRVLLKNKSLGDNLTLEDLEDLAKRWNMQLVTVDQRIPLETPSSLTLHANFSSATVSSAINESEFTDALERVVSNASTINESSAKGITIDELKVQATRLGFTVQPLIDESEMSELERRTSIIESLDNYGDDESDEDDDSASKLDTTLRDLATNKDDLLAKASELGLVVLEQDDFELLNNKEVSRTEIEAQAQALGLKILDEEEYYRLEVQSVPIESEIRAMSSDMGLVVLNENELESFKASVIESADVQELVNEKNIVALAEKLNFKAFTESEYKSWVSKATEKIISKEAFIEQAQEYGLVAMEAHDFEEFMTQKDREKPSNEEELASSTSSTGLADISNNKSNDTNPSELSIKDISTKAHSLGYTAVPTDEYELQLHELSKLGDVKYLSMKLKNKGLETIDSKELESLYEKANAKWTKDDIVSRSELFGMIPIPISSYEAYKSSSSAPSVVLSREEIIRKAQELGLSAISIEELELLKLKAANGQQSHILESKQKGELDHKRLESAAKELGLLTIPESAFVATNVSRIPDVNNVVVLPLTYYNRLTRAESLATKKITNDELQAQVKARGFRMVYEGDSLSRDSLAQLAPPTPVTKRAVVSVSNSNSRKNLSELASAAAQHELDQQSTRLSRASSKHQYHPPSFKNNSPGVSRDISIDGGLSLLTNASLSEPNIIPALTQTVIGEYLFKYYRRLGPFSSISESRHERYFWIHPYTLTLYWSSTNPVLGNPTNHKTRAAAIIQVESIEDNNPLPTGLYHKSIIVHSQTRSIKFTCPTRQRHNIWYNSLRYLIQRNMDGIVLENDLEIVNS